jgi:hypothetical protein
VVSCALASLIADRSGSAWLFDTAGDVPSALGIAEPSGPGVLDWIASVSAPTHAIDALGVAASKGLRVVPRGSASAAADHQRWEQLGRYLADRDAPSVIDAGTGLPPNALLMAAQQRLLVIRPCYLALRKVAASGLKPTGVIVVHEPGRVLHAGDVAASVQAPVVAEIGLDIAVARAVDAGLLAARMPRLLSTALRGLLG